jgi:hypothetical protein
MRLWVVTLLCAPVLAQSDAGFADWRERWDYYVHRTYTWQRLGLVALDTVAEMPFNAAACGRPPYCFPHHYGGAVFRRTTRTTLELAFGAALHEDARRRPSGLSGFGPRLRFALTHALLARGPDGAFRPAYSRFAGTLGGIAVYSAWDGRPITTRRVAIGFSWALTSSFQDALLTEFSPDLRRIGRRLAPPRLRRF